MSNKSTIDWVPDLMFRKAERDAKDYSVFPGDKSPSASFDLDGLISREFAAARAEELRALEVDDYVESALMPAESPQRPSAKEVISQLRGHVVREISDGPFYALEMNLEFAGGPRRVGIIAQDRSTANGVWGPAHHLRAVKLVREFAEMSLPVVTFMDTPGADAGADANANNQAHSISALLAEMCNLPVASVGVVYGLGYSGGAIPLAATNILLATRSAAFNTIQPKGLASIARQYNLSWQECARYVGISAFELVTKGVIDGVIDYRPEDSTPQIENLQRAITSAIESTEESCREFTLSEPIVLEQYHRGLSRYLNPPAALATIKEVSEFSFASARRSIPDVFGLATRHLRYVGLRRRIRTSTTEGYGRLANIEIPTGDLSDRVKTSRESDYQEWLSDSDRIIYNESLLKATKQFRSRREGLNKDRNRITAYLLGEPQRNYENARFALCFQVGLYLYNRWKTASSYNFRQVIATLTQHKNSISGDELAAIADGDITVNDLVFCEELRQEMIGNFVNLLIFDSLYDSIVNGFADIAEEARHSHTISRESLQQLLESSLAKAALSVSDTEASTDETGQFLMANSSQYSEWIRYFVRFNGRGAFLKDVEEWKRVAFTRLSDALLVLITFIFEDLLPRFLDSQTSGKKYQGKINPTRIGKRKDFWNQLDIAYNDVLVQRVLDDYKKRKLVTVDAIRDRFFNDFDEQDANLMSADPVSFPGFRLSLERALKNKQTPCGVVTAIANLGFGPGTKVGVLISNVGFQAGAFDMASSEKMCRLLAECVRLRLPVICFVSSGGMQTKEGPSSLFAMAVANDRITRFVRDNDLPVVVFGFGDCTGGSQASFVTHPLVQTYYFSGTNMPFAGRVVVPSFLPSNVIVSNYLSTHPGSMRGLVKHPFAPELDDELRAVDPEIPVPGETCEEVIERVFKGSYLPVALKRSELESVDDRDLMKPVRKVLIHARGCTAVKLTRVAKARGASVVLVQSDPDMDSVAADLLGENDEVISLGGQTPDESYLNATSVFAIARREQVDSLHPGIGFLSENEDFARSCRSRRVNFIGPYAKNMAVMGNKSNAISTSMANNVPVVPGSHGILTSPEATAEVADDIGYPVLLKAVHGGGGKGIKVVRSAADVHSAFQTVFAEARSAFGSGDLYLEKFVESMRHIEVQILRDSHGNTRVLGLRDCSVQRNNQKVLEESESVALPGHLEEAAYEHARQLADAIDYLGAGTVEFIFDLRAEALYFMEMNTRLQVEHPVTEWTSGISIVGEQFRIAEGESIAEIEPTQKGYSIEARVTAEQGAYDGDGNIYFVPTPGLVTKAEFPEGDGIEIIECIASGKAISPFYDSLIAQVVVYAEDRASGLAKLARILRETHIQGVCTNIPLLLAIIDDEIFQRGHYDTGYLPDFLGRVDKDQLIADMGATGESTGDTSVEIEGSKELKVLSPMTGVFYTTPAPADPAYVSVGEEIDLNATLCQIEAMKLFSTVTLASFNGASPIYPGARYRVNRVNQTNGAQVNAGDLLFVIEPCE